MAAGRDTVSMDPRTHSSASRALKAVDFLVVGLCMIVFALNAAGIATTLLTDGYAGQRDFLTYWC
jgi:hypothetical protein